VGDFLYVRADENFALGAPVTGTVDADYAADWLCDGRNKRPAKSVNGNANWTATFLVAGEVGLIGICSHNVSVDAVVTGGTILGAPATENGIFLDRFVKVTPATIGSVNVTVTGNPVDVTIGELVAGKLRKLPQFPTMSSYEGNVLDFRRTGRGEFTSILPGDPGEEARSVTCSVTGGQALLDEIMSIARAQRATSRPMFIIPDDSFNDLWCCMISPPKWKPKGYYMFEISWNVIELPRPRWGV
jgi:hypothetical protein